MSDEASTYQSPDQVTCPICGMPPGRPCARLDGGGSLSGGWHHAREHQASLPQPTAPTLTVHRGATVPETDPATLVVRALRVAGIPAKVLAWEGPGGIVQLTPEHRGPAMSVLAGLGCASAVHPRGLSVATPQVSEADEGRMPGQLRIVITCTEETPQSDLDGVAMAAWVELVVREELAAAGLPVLDVQLRR